MGTVSIPMRRSADALDLPVPAYSSEGASGLDLFAAVEHPVTLQPGERALIRTGITVAIPDGYEGQIRARSGQAWKRGLGMVNAPGTIDSDYRGEIQVILINWGHSSEIIQRGERIAQLVIAPVARAILSEVDDLPETARGSGGFGHTGS